MMILQSRDPNMGRRDSRCGQRRRTEGRGRGGDDAHEPPACHGPDQRYERQARHQHRNPDRRCDLCLYGHEKAAGRSQQHRSFGFQRAGGDNEAVGQGLRRASVLHDLGRSGPRHDADTGRQMVTVRMTGIAQDAWEPGIETEDPDEPARHAGTGACRSMSGSQVARPGNSTNRTTISTMIPNIGSAVRAM